MKKLLYLITATLLAVSCAREDVDLSPAPEAKIDEQLSGDINLAVGQNFQVVNKTTGAESFLWDLGNGKTLTTRDAQLFYTVPGIYTLTLTATSATGKVSTLTRTVKIFDYILKGVSLKDLNLQGYPTSVYAPGNVELPVFSSAELWVEIKQMKEGETYTAGLDLDRNAPVLWKSPVVSYTDGDTKEISFDIPPMPLNFMANDFASYGLNLYARTNSGTYMIASSWAAYIHATAENTDLTKFTISETMTFTLAVSNPSAAEMDFHGAMELPK